MRFRSILPLHDANIRCALWSPVAALVHRLETEACPALAAFPVAIRDIGGTAQAHVIVTLGDGSRHRFSADEARALATALGHAAGVAADLDGWAIALCEAAYDADTKAATLIIGRDFGAWA